jgi:hypothetical protein
LVAEGALSLAYLISQGCDYPAMLFVFLLSGEKGAVGFRVVISALGGYRREVLMAACGQD